MAGRLTLSHWLLPAACLLLGFAMPIASPADEGSAMGYGELSYQLPAVGSYTLPSLGNAPDGDVLDEQGQPQRLHALYQGKYTVLSFIYSNCNDVNGCPLSSYVLYKLKAKMGELPELANSLRLISLSFDPERDTPAVMRSYANNFKYASTAGEWRFLTTASLPALLPTLEGYHQDIQREMTVNGDPTGQYGHLLRVFLIDPQFRIRNIYSVGFLHADVILNDLHTLLAESKILTSQPPLPKGEGEQEIRLSEALTQRSSNADRNGMRELSRAGDDKTGYGQTTYTTRSQAVAARQGQPADLLQIAQQPPLGLPPTPVPADNPLTTDKIALGRQLFYDRRLSLNDTFSCAMCHIPEQGFTSHELSTAVGLEGRSVRRNSPSLYNVAHVKHLFHDGREDNLEQQVWSPLLAHNEMANPSMGYVLNKIRQIPDYQGKFETAFAGQGLNILTLGQALASYERTLLSADSAFDRWQYGKQADALSADALQGFRLFTGKANCVACHSIGKDSALFTDQQWHHTGVGYQDSMGVAPAKQKLQLAPGVFVDVDSARIASVSEPKPADLGRYEITQNPQDRWKYTTPSLRNVSLTAPYMHNGSLQTLEDVVQFYNQGGIANELLDPLMKPLGLTDTEVQQLVTFLQSLEGSNVNTLVADAFAAPVGDLTSDDPHWTHEAQHE